MAVNREYADADARLHAGDELALIPPVSGGETAAAPHVRVTAEPLSLDALAARVRDPRAGAVITFSGVTRDVPRLEYEAYAEMAEPRMAEIVEAAIAKHGLCVAAAEHRIGEVPLSEPSVIVAVSAAHRGEAFAGAREIIDRIKAEAPIWKKEVSEEGEAWVEGTPPPTA
jgi:molybdopterin synthase catalytic subunit